MANKAEDAEASKESYSDLAEISLVQYSRELGALYEATAALLSTLDIEQLLGKILDSATTAIPVSEKGTIYLLAPETGQLEIRAVLGYSETDPRIHQLARLQSFPYIDEAVNSRVPILVSPSEDSNIAHPFIVAPLIMENKVLGVIALEANNEADFSQRDLRLLANFAVTATAAIRNAQLHAEVQKQAITDDLTGLYNRRGLIELGDREVERAWRYSRNLATIMLDIDDLKTINDTLGHAVGDEVIKAVARICQTNTRKIDVACRYGGDEFVILLPENDLFAAAKVAERLRQAISNSPIILDDLVINISVSMGVSKVSKEIKDLNSLFRAADEALYLAKTQGKDQTVIK